jgi:hypothetical protein
MMMMFPLLLLLLLLLYRTLVVLHLQSFCEVLLLRRL